MGNGGSHGGRHPDAGFTLVELMVVVAMVAVLAGIAVSYAGEKRANLRGFTGEVVGQCDSARLRALSTRRWHRITFAPTEARVQVWQASTTGMEQPDVDDDDLWNLMQEFEIPRSVEISAVATSADVDGGGSPGAGEGLDEALLFGPDGTAESRTVYLGTRDGRSKARVLIYRATGTAYAKDGW